MGGLLILCEQVQLTLFQPTHLLFVSSAAGSGLICSDRRSFSITAVAEANANANQECHTKWVIELSDKMAGSLNISD